MAKFIFAVHYVYAYIQNGCRMYPAASNRIRVRYSRKRTERY